MEEPLSEGEIRDLEAAFQKRYAEDVEVLRRLASLPNIRPSEKHRADHLKSISDRGLATFVNRKGAGVVKETLQLVREFTAHGAKAILMVGPQRGGDFLNNQLRGQWAERVVLSMKVDGAVLLPLGPSGAAMPGEQDHREVVMTFREIQLFEGKRPDIIVFRTEDWDALEPTAREMVQSWPRRRLLPKDESLLRKGLCGIEVKNSTWHYSKRREAGGGPLAITVKEEEVEVLREWSRTYGVPILFSQVLFDEIYCMSFQRMVEAIGRGQVYRSGDYLEDKQTGADEKVYHRFFLENFDHLCAKVIFPGDSAAHIRVLGDGSVVPYLEYKPANAEDVRPEVIYREIAYRS